MKMKKTLSLLLIIFFVQLNSQNNKEAYFASGCFWCVESIYESLIGVSKVESGYSGGYTKDPSYYSVLTGKTGHAESIKVYYDAEKISFKELVKVFFGSHDPTTKNGQHPDYGSQYRSIAFYKTIDEKNLIEAAIQKLNKEIYNNKIVTEVTKFSVFYEAEDYHQNYEKRNPYDRYVRNVSIPRLKRFQKKFPDLLKATH